MRGKDSDIESKTCHKIKRVGANVEDGKKGEMEGEVEC